jgi:hypothetical protein
MSRYNWARVLAGTPEEVNRELVKVEQAGRSAVFTDTAATITAAHTFTARQTFSAGLAIAGVTASNVTLTAVSAANVAGVVMTVPTVQDWSVGVRTTGAFVLNSGNAFAGTDVVSISAAGAVRLGASGGAVGFLGATPATRPTVTGAKGGNAALASLLTALAALGLVTDSTT